MSIQKPILFIILSIFTFSFSNCGNSKVNSKSIKFQQTPPFTVQNATSEKWMAGTKEGGSGVQLSLNVTDVKEGVELKDLYFRNKVVAAKTNAKSGTLYVGNYTDDKKDFVMHSDPKMEAKDTVKESFPFELTENEAVFSYTYQGTLLFYKITEIIEKEPLPFPTINQNGNK
ncbi:hypothetical protein SCB49_05662 [unidentified eubacterium SCB49]|nr:hypothetical protein SCB49_05662 [unidentified eubacterium SCB49]